MQIKRNYPLPELPIREGMSALRNIGSLYRTKFIHYKRKNSSWNILKTFKTGSYPW